MDFPISVPSVGLVDGKFVDEDPLLGTPGSLIPSKWGNAITDEVLHVIAGAGLIPDEEDNTQLKAAITQMVVDSVVPIASQSEAETGIDNTKRMTPLRVFQAIAKVVVQATESSFGWAKIATHTQVNTGVNDSTMVTPLKLRAGFSCNLATTGYIAFPTWLGGVIIQWGGATFQVGTSITQSSGSLPIAFPNAAFRIFGYRTSELQATNSPTTDHYFTVSSTLWFVNHVRSAGSVSVPFSYIAIGW